MLRDLQFNVFGKRIMELFTVTEFDMLTSGHWAQFVLLHFWFGRSLCSMLNTLFLTDSSTGNLYQILLENNVIREKIPFFLIPFKSVVLGFLM